MLAVAPGAARPKRAAGYLFCAFFAAQRAFILAEIFAFAARLMVRFFTGARVVFAAFLPARNFAQRACCAAAIFFRAFALSLLRAEVALGCGRSPSIRESSRFKD